MAGEVRVRLDPRLHGVVCDAAVAASERTSAAAACAVYSRIIAPESGPGSCASCGVSPVTSGSSSALTRAAISDADCAIAPRSESSASVSTPAWKLPFGSATPSRGQHQRVLARDVELDLEHAGEPLERLEQRALDLRHAAEHERVVDRAAGRALARLARAEQLAQPPRDLDLAAVRARGVHARVEHREVGVGGLVGQRGDAERGVEQPRRVVEDERGLADADGVGAHERDPVARAVADRLEPVRGERLGGGHDVVADPALALAAERRRRSRPAR